MHRKNAAARSFVGRCGIDGVNMSETNLPEDFLKRLKSVTAKRAKTVIDLILKQGQVTTEDLARAGYEHAPRAVRDVRELGIPIVTNRTKDRNGKSIAVYTFGNPNLCVNQIRKKEGRTAVLNKIRQKLIQHDGAHCAIYLEEMDEKELQVDHRVPFEIGGEQNTEDISQFMLLSPSANRKKSWSCEHCPNWMEKNIAMCRTCFWAYPDSYQHIAGEQERIVMVRLRGEDTLLYDAIEKRYGRNGVSEIVRNALREEGEKQHGKHVGN